MKKRNYSIAYLIYTAIGLLIISCDAEDPVASKVGGFEEFPITSVTDPMTVTEAGTYTIEFELDDRQIVATDIVIAVSDSSTAVEDTDFTLSTHTVSLDAFEGFGSFDITISPDTDIEGDETIILTLEGDNIIGSPPKREFLALTIRDSIYFPGLRLAWDDSVTIGGQTISLCDSMDVDLLVTDADGDFAGGFAGATASCPETMISLGNLDDGVYTINANIFDNAIADNGTMDSVDVPLTLSLFQVQFTPADEATIVLKTDEEAGTEVWTTNVASDPSGDALLTVGFLEISGDSWILKNAADETIGTLMVQ